MQSVILMSGVISSVHVCDGSVTKVWYPYLHCCCYIPVLSATPRKSKISTAALVGIVVGAIAGAVTLSALVSLLILRKRSRNYRAITKRRRGECLAFPGLELCKYVLFLCGVLSIYCEFFITKVHC